MGNDKLSPDMQEKVDRVLANSDIGQAGLKNPAKEKAELTQEVGSDGAKRKHNRN
jgi:hypothetical protein